MLRTAKFKEMADKTTSSLVWIISFSDSSVDYISQRLSPTLRHSLTQCCVSLGQALKTSELVKDLHSFHIPPISWGHTLLAS